jgi:hypothetical protein
MSESPFTFPEARAAAHAASQRQLDGEDHRRNAAMQLAEAERQFRMALAVKMTQLHATGVAWTAVADLARGDRQVAQLRYDRDVAKGVSEAAEGAGYRLQADRRVLERLVEWSMRRELAEGAGVA